MKGRGFPVLLLAVLVVSPIAAAVLAIALGAPDVVAPLIVVAAGVGWGTLGGRMVMGVARRYAESKNVPEWQALDDVSGEELLADNPLFVFVPFLVTAAWMTALIGLVWLVIVDYRVALAVVAIGVAVWFVAWRRAAPRRREMDASENVG